MPSSRTISPPWAARISRAPSGPTGRPSLPASRPPGPWRPATSPGSRPVQAGSPVDGSSRWWAKPVLGPPEAGLDAAGRDRAAIEHELVGGSLSSSGWSMRTWRSSGLLPAEPQIATGIDDEGGVAAQPIGGQVRGQALAAAAGVDPDARGPVDDPGDGIDGDPRASGSPHAGTAGLRSGATASASSMPAGRKVGARGRVAGVLELADEGRVHEAIGAPRRPEGRVDRDRQGRADRAGLARLGVERAELAALDRNGSACGAGAGGRTRSGCPSPRAREGPGRTGAPISTRTCEPKSLKRRSFSTNGWVRARDHDRDSRSGAMNSAVRGR